MSNKSHYGVANSNWRGGMASHPLYLIYHDMIGRCHRSSHRRYADYGGRGITVCQRWLDDFWAFVADMGDRPQGAVGSDGRSLSSIDRIDNDRGYGPGNCRWATPAEQRANRRKQRLNATCKHGHEYTPENTRIDPLGKRRCRACEREWARQGRARRRAAV